MIKKKNYLEVKPKIKYICFFVLYVFCHPLAKLFYGRKNNWLICERGIDAQDNGFVFFNYIFFAVLGLSC